MRRLQVLAVAILSCISLTAHSARHALVIGNDNYTHITPLKNARADAKVMAKSLEDAGFKVTLKTDLAEKPMTRTLREFSEQVSGGDEVVIFYAGHGVQISGSNYLLPIDLTGESESQVKDDAIALQKVLDQLQDQKAAFTLAIVDACRDNPFKGTGRAIGSRGLVPTNPASGQMIIFSAGTGQQALDRVGKHDTSPNSLFTRVFVNEIAKPGLLVRDALYNVRDEVVRLAKTVGHEQVPAIYDQSTGKFYFQSGVSPKAVQAAQATAGEDSLKEVAWPDADRELWTAAARSNTADDLQAYLTQYPKGHYAAEAKKRLGKLKQAEQAATARQEKDTWAQAEKLSSVEGYRTYLDTYPQGLYRALAQARLKRLDTAGGKAFKDCADCPEMLRIPSGRFNMGSPVTESGRNENQGPVHAVDVPSFALGKYEVTRGQFAAFMRDTGYRVDDYCWTDLGQRHGPGFSQNAQHPVTCVSWHDAQAYVSWLARKTGKLYRLPSEAEWEYAARAGSNSALYWGNFDEPACEFANLEDSLDKCKDGMTHTAPVGSYRPNDFGLYDMIGNVWEWTADCQNNSYAGAPSNGKAWDVGDCENRVLRGGAWSSDALLTRSASRLMFMANYNSYDHGFRVALSLRK